MHSATSQRVLVYDVGGSHVAAATCRAGDFALGRVVQGPHPEEHTSEAFVNLLEALGQEAVVEAGSAPGACVAMPGPFDYAAGVSWMQHKLPYLYGFDLRAALAERFGWRVEQVRFLNDAAAYLLGEVGAGAAKGCARAVVITLGTGIGSAFAVDGRIVTEGCGVPPGGEIWNLPYEGGIVEDQFSTRALRKSYAERTGQERDVKTMAMDAAHDEAARAVFADFGRRLGRMLKRVFAEFAPDVVVVGGGIARSAQLFLPFAQQTMDGARFALLVSALGDHAPLVGAGVAWFAAANTAEAPPDGPTQQGE